MRTVEALQRKWVVGPFQCNCRLIVCPRTGKALLIDPGDEPQRLIQELDSLKKDGVEVKIEYLLHTHGHLDHIGGTRGVALAIEGSDLKRPKISLHKMDYELYLNLKTQGQLFGATYDEPLAVDHFIEHEEVIEVGDLRITVVHTPGHSPGSACFRLHEDSALGTKETLFSGDTLFQGSVGRTDLWGADQDQMFSSIRNRILTLDDEIQVCPGHGADSSVGIERRNNPFLN